MSQYTSTIRTSFFRVRSPRSFKQLCERFGLDPDEKESAEHGCRLHAFTLREGEQSLTSSFHDHAASEDVDAEIFLEELSRELADGWTAVITEVGADDLLVLKGRATAVNWLGDTRSVDLYDIHTLARELGGTSTPCEA